MSVQHWFGFWLEITASRGPLGSLRPSAMNSAHWRRCVKGILDQASRSEEIFFPQKSIHICISYRVYIWSLFFQFIFVLDDGFQVRQLVFNLSTNQIHDNFFNLLGEK